ncbi:hypothetical protein GCM10015535_28100 [Streptomyces gelaticus]|uniref:Uncharacterized protein n=1 Tax=Streptomyces gelaticus TaxID=285446 RepID=A0ABQ2VY18_9ACTN|nr:hypothetical protein GCM10015535_28100 [Streptomyces gelaticus]
MLQEQCVGPGLRWSAYVGPWSGPRSTWMSTLNVDPQAQAAEALPPAPLVRGLRLDGHNPAASTERQPAQTSASSAGTVVASPSSLRAATDLFGSMPVNAGS